MAKPFLKKLSAFSRLNYEERLKKLQNLNYISVEDIKYLKAGSVSPSLKSRVELTQCFIENALGYFPLPLGVATNFIVNGQPYLIPMAVEESSIIAAASKTARWICENGSICSQTLNHYSIGQVQFPKVKNVSALENCIAEAFDTWRQTINNSVLSSMSKRGGGLKDYSIRKIKRDDGHVMLIVHLLIDTCEAMGANVINQTCEFFKPLVEKQSGEKVGLCILSNLADQRMVKSQVIIKNQDQKLIRQLEEASLFAEKDSYRACTSNKGVLNGVDALLIATGNDWRAVSAGLHAYASRQGFYSSLTQWRVVGEELHGEMQGPFMLGTVGGVTDLHPTARLCLKILKNPSSQELAGLACALGLVQNLGALRALVTEGVIEGHMRLHAKNMVLKAGAKNPEESQKLEIELIKVLKKTKHLSLNHAISLLKKIRKSQKSQKI